MPVGRTAQAAQAVQCVSFHSLPVTNSVVSMWNSAMLLWCHLVLCGAMWCSVVQRGTV